jgi:NAD(P) transhydrogenase
MAHYDLIIIGSGPAGRAAAIQAGKLKRKVLVVDRKDRLGGVSVHTGTIPSKTLRETVLNLSGYRERSFYGRSYRVKDNIDAGDLKAWRSLSGQTRSKLPQKRATPAASLATSF